MGKKTMYLRSGGEFELLLKLFAASGELGYSLLKMLPERYRQIICALRDPAMAYKIKNESWTALDTQGRAVAVRIGRGVEKRVRLNEPARVSLLSTIPGHIFYSEHFGYSGAFSGGHRVFRKRIATSEWNTVCELGGVRYDPDSLPPLYNVIGGKGVFGAKGFHATKGIDKGDPRIVKEPLFYQSVLVKETDEASYRHTNMSRYVGVLITKNESYICYPALTKNSVIGYTGERTARDYLFGTFLPANFADRDDEVSRAIVLSHGGYEEAEEAMYAHPVVKSSKGPRRSTETLRSCFSDVCVVREDRSAGKYIHLIAHKDEYLESRKQKYCPQAGTSQIWNCDAFDNATSTIFIFFGTGNVAALCGTVDTLKSIQEMPGKTPNKLTVVCFEDQREYVESKLRDLKNKSIIVE